MSIDKDRWAPPHEGEKSGRPSPSQATRPSNTPPRNADTSVNPDVIEDSYTTAITATLPDESVDSSRRRAFRAGATRAGSSVRSALSFTKTSKGWGTLAVVVFVAALFGAIALRTSAGSSSLATSRPQGYRGTATNTETLSSAWASGINTAWVLPSAPDKASTEEQSVLVEGTTLYVATRTQERVLRVSAYDIASVQPVQKWVSDGQDIEVRGRFGGPRMISAGAWVVVENVLVSKETGRQQEAPWGEDIPAAFVDEVLVTCSGLETCSGWTNQSGSWTRQWQSITARQSSSSDFWKGIHSLVVGSGEESSLLVPVESFRHNPQLVNVHTGVVATLGAEGRLGSGSRVVKLYDASDGVIVERDRGEMEVYDVSGRLVDTFDPVRHNTQPTMDGRAPTVAELRGFFTEVSAPWTTGRVTIEKEDCSVVKLTPTGDFPPRSATGVKGLTTYYSYTSKTCSFEPRELRASTDGSAAFIWVATWSTSTAYMIDMNANKTHTFSGLTRSTKTVWAFDDLLITISDDGITAFTPASS